MSSPRSMLRAIQAHPEDAVQRLAVLREIVAERLDGTESARETASLARCMLDIESALRGYAGATEKTPVDELLAKRKARGVS